MLYLFYTVLVGPSYLFFNIITIVTADIILLLAFTGDPSDEGCIDDQTNTMYLIDLSFVCYLFCMSCWLIQMLSPS